MAGTLQKARRRADVLAHLGRILRLDLTVQARGDPELAEIMRLEMILETVDDLVNQNNHLILTAAGHQELRNIIAQASDAEIAQIPYVPRTGISKIRQWAEREES